MSMFAVRGWCGGRPGTLSRRYVSLNSADMLRTAIIGERALESPECCKLGVIYPVMLSLTDEPVGWNRY